MGRDTVDEGKKRQGKAGFAKQIRKQVKQVKVIQGHEVKKKQSGSRKAIQNPGLTGYFQNITEWVAIFGLPGSNVKYY